MTLALTLAILAFLPITAAHAVEHRETLSRELPLKNSDSVSLENLAGHISIEPASGANVEIEMTVVAEDGNKADAKELAQRVSLSVKHRGGQLVLLAEYPVKDHADYHYPRSGKNSSFSFGSRSRSEYQGRRVTVHGNRSRGALTLYADIVLRLPSGLKTEIRNVAGVIEAKGIHGDLRLDTGSGDIHAQDGQGSINADTGSGDVKVLRYHGPVNADTGSGDVFLTEIEGDVEVDSGSGSVNLRAIQAESISADTGSGDIRLEDAEGSLSADTGSGDVVGRELVLFGRLAADTGSGDVSLEGNFGAVEGIDIDTGSGEVTLRGSAFPAMNLRIDTGSGDIEVDLPGADVLVAKKGEYRACFGDASVRAVIGTGSGEVTLREN
jgi:DUF4097 and DUF4098 domain-containing protein YvlB